MRDLGPEGGVPLLEARGLRWHARGQAVIDDVDLRIEPGRRLVVLGPNGAGKSLLLRLLHGLIKPDAGAVLWSGTPLDGTGRGQQAMVFQRPVLLRRSVLGNVRFALAAQGVPRKERASRAAAALAQAGLSGLAERPARVLSGGEQQRLALARALALRPRMLLLDEPTANLDPAATKAVEDLIDAAHLAGVTVILVTHDLGQARRMGDDAAFLHAGRIVEAGPAGQVLYHPRSPQAQAWCGGRLYLDPPTPETI